MSFQSLNSALWNQRQLLELLVFKLEVEQLLLAAGKSKWLPQSTAEIERLVEQLSEVELSRSVESHAIALELGLPTESSLLALAEAAPEPWGELLHGHRSALIQVATEIDGLTTGSRELMSATQRAVQETLSTLEQDPATYDASGTPQVSQAKPRLFDRNL